MSITKSNLARPVLPLDITRSFSFILPIWRAMGETVQDCWTVVAVSFRTLPASPRSALAFSLRDV